jgi:hypothetical protein
VQHRHILKSFLLFDQSRLQCERDDRSRDRAIGICDILLQQHQEFAELHDLIDVKYRLLEHAGHRRVEAGQLGQPLLIELGQWHDAQLALKFQIVGDLLAVGDLVEQSNGSRQLAFELVARFDTQHAGLRLAPPPRRIWVGGVVRLIGLDRPVFDRRIDAFEIAEVHILGQIDGTRRLGDDEARLGDVHVQLFDGRLLVAIGAGRHLFWV